jgi:hypothetical protein
MVQTQTKMVKGLFASQAAAHLTTLGAKNITIML